MVSEQTGGPAGRSTPAAGSRPNIVVILADDMGWGDLGCYGAAGVPTPNIDRLATEGMRFLDCHSSSAVCTPSRYSLMTGRYAWRSPLKRGVLMGHSPPIIEPDRPTIASTLKQAGYATGAFGKWHLGLGWRRRDGSVDDAFGPDGVVYMDPDHRIGREDDSGSDVDYQAPFSGGPTTLGFDRFFGIAGSLDMAPYCFLDQDRTVGIPDRRKDVQETGQRPGLTVDGWHDDQVDVQFATEAARWIHAQAADEAPFFLYLATAAPHRPCVPPEFVRGRSQIGRRGDAVCLVDWMVGQVMDALDATGQADNTLVVVTSDNGAPLIAADGDIVTHRANGPWRGQKGDIWDGGHREPFVARWPRRIRPGSIAEDLVCLTDLMPTVAALAGVESDGEDGVDLLPALLGEANPAAGRAVVHHSFGGAFAIRRDRWKAIFTTGAGRGFSELPRTGSVPRAVLCDGQHADGQLYDVVDDPAEQRNLWLDRQDVVVGLYRDLREICGDPSSGLAFDIPLPVNGA